MTWLCDWRINTRSDLKRPKGSDKRIDGTKWIISDAKMYFILDKTCDYSHTWLLGMQMTWRRTKKNTNPNAIKCSIYIYLYALIHTHTHILNKYSHTLSSNIWRNCACALVYPIPSNSEYDLTLFITDLLLLLFLSLHKHSLGIWYHSYSIASSRTKLTHIYIHIQLYPIYGLNAIAMTRTADIMVLVDWPQSAQWKRPQKIWRF